MPDNRITLVLEGSERDGGDIRFDVFLAELRQLNQALTRIDESIAQGKRNSHFAVVGLHHGSPATVELEPRVNRGHQDVRPQIAARLVHAIESAESGDVREDIDYDLLIDLRDLAAPVGQQLRSATLKINGGSFELTREFSKKIEVHLAQHETCYGAVEGMLERINVHLDANIFTIYPDVGPASLKCYFPVELVEAALAAGKRRVSVSGVLQYRKLSPYPYQLQARGIEIYDPEDALPTFDDLRGLAPDATGDEPAADFIARFRDGWV